MDDFFYLRIPNLYLRASEYSIRFLITEGDTASHNFIDLIDQAINVNVLAGQIWQGGRLNRKGANAIIPASIDFE